MASAASGSMRVAAAVAAPLSKARRLEVEVALLPMPADVVVTGVGTSSPLAGLVSTAIPRANDLRVGICSCEIARLSQVV